MSTKGQVRGHFLDLALRRSRRPAQSACPWRSGTADAEHPEAVQVVWRLCKHRQSVGGGLYASPHA
ncbi:DUF3459 domain-containing protein [Streptomyces yangpuensis]|uniref:DUF3459 domain-containing protein n=1 Tax=Streptomyces yangpuensis TaxID=1648182 RepID=UPI003713B527